MCFEKNGRVMLNLSISCVLGKCGADISKKNHQGMLAGGAWTKRRIMEVKNGWKEHFIKCGKRLIRSEHHENDGFSTFDNGNHPLVPNR